MNLIAYLYYISFLQVYSHKPKQNHLNLDYSSFRQDIRILSYVYDDLKINDILKGTDNIESSISSSLFS